jgi:polar amino acid transport system permease protein
VGTYVELIRNTPFIVQLFFIFFGLPAAGVKLSPETASVIAMVMNLGAYATEIIRAGIEATPRGRSKRPKAWRSTAQVFTRVVLPPALKKVWPAMVSQIIIVMLGSAVCGQISTEELSYAANLIQSRNFRAFEAFIIATLIYLALSVALRRCSTGRGPRSSSAAERRTKHHDRIFSLGHLAQPAAGARWTVVLSLIAFIGGGIVGGLLLVAAPPAAGRAGGAHRCRPVRAAVPGHAAADAAVPRLLRPGAVRHQRVGLDGGRVALTLYTSAYLAEIWRGCVAAIPKGQWEAAQPGAELRRAAAPSCCRRPCASPCRRRWASWCRSSRARRWPR